MIGSFALQGLPCLRICVRAFEPEGRLDVQKHLFFEGKYFLGKKRLDDRHLSRHSIKPPNGSTFGQMQSIHFWNKPGEEVFCGEFQPNFMTNSILSTSPWPWYVAGPCVAASMFFLLWLGRRLGFSSSTQVICAIAGAGAKWDYFKIDWKARMWQIALVVGLMAGGWLSGEVIPGAVSPQISSATAADIEALGLTVNEGWVPKEIFSWEGLFTIQGFVIIVLGGFLTGFGARWAGGCTAGHMISGMSELQLPSLISSVCFIVGGAVSSNFIIPFLFGL